MLHVRDAQGGVVKLGKYDGSLGMFVEPEPRILNLNHLAYLRYLAEMGRLEHAVESAPSGPVLDDVVRAPAY